MSALIVTERIPAPEGEGETDPLGPAGEQVQPLFSLVHCERRGCMPPQIAGASAHARL
jgi:hypothetical protein